MVVRQMATAVVAGVTVVLLTADQQTTSDPEVIMVELTTEQTVPEKTVAVERPSSREP